MESIIHNIDPKVEKAVAAIWPEATWASLKHNSSKQQMTFVAGRGRGPSMGLKVVGLDGAQKRQWYATEGYEDGTPDWIDAKDAPKDEALVHLQPTAEQFERLQAVRPVIEPDQAYLFGKFLQ